MPWVAAAAAIGAALIQANSANQAADAQTQATTNATGEAAREYNVSRNDLAPYRDAGNAALVKVRQLLGIAPPTGTAAYGGSLIDMSGGAPAPIAGLYQADPAYRKAWDDTLAAHNAWSMAPASKGGIGGAPGYSAASDVNWINEQLRARLPAADPNAATTGIGPSVGDIMALDPGYQFRLNQGSRALTNAAGASGMLNSGATAKALTRYGQDYASGEFNNIYNRLAGTAGIGQNATNTTATLGANTAGTIGNLLTSGANARGAAAISAGNAGAGALNSFGNNYMQQQTLDQILASRGGSNGAYTGNAYAG